MKVLLHIKQMRYLPPCIMDYIPCVDNKERIMDYINDNSVYLLSYDEVFFTGVWEDNDALMLRSFW